MKNLQLMKLMSYIVEVLRLCRPSFEPCVIGVPSREKGVVIWGASFWITFYCTDCSIEVVRMLSRDPEAM